MKGKETYGDSNRAIPQDQFERIDREQQRRQDNVRTKDLDRIDREQSRRNEKNR